MSRHHDRERDLQRRLEATLAPALPQVEVLDVELDTPRSTVRVAIDHPEGVGVELCTRVTRTVRDVCPELALEVSSPGPERPLRRPDHFADAVGRRARLRREGAPRASVVEIEGVEDAGVRVRSTGPDPASDVVPFDQIVRCRLVAPVPKPVAKPGKRQRKGPA